MTEIKTVRTTKEIKADLLRRALSGNSGHTPGQMILLIQWICSRSRSLSQDHSDALNEVDSSQPRAVMSLNAQARYLGLPIRYAETSGGHFFMPETSTIQ